MIVAGHGGSNGHGKPATKTAGVVRGKAQPYVHAARLLLHLLARVSQVERQPSGMDEDQAPPAHH